MTGEFLSGKAASTRKEGAKSNQIRIVIAEDEAITALAVRAHLEKAGYTVIGEASDGRSAVEMATRLAPDLVVMDIKMPLMDGIEAAARINSQRPTAIIILTGYSEPEFIERAREAGVLGYLVKPVKIEELVPAVEVARSLFQAMDSLRHEVYELRQALEERKIVEKAKGILMKRFSISEEEAYQRLRKQSRNQRRRLVEVARSVIAVEELLS